MKPVFRLLLAACVLLATAQAYSADYDLVINNGRVIDPETGFDKTSNIGIKKGTIITISNNELDGRSSIDASGKVVAPGFIDVHTHTPTLLGQHVNVLDGITTALDLEAGAFPVTFYGEHFVGGAQINFGASVGHFAIRIKVMEGIDQPYFITGRKGGSLKGDAFSKVASAEQIEEMRKLVNRGVDQGGLGIGVLLDYMTDAVSDAELAMLFEVAADRGVPINVHVRRGFTGDPAGLIEVIDLAKKTKASLFICHITHNAMGRVGEWLAMIDAANADGENIATETLSYGAGGTSISADVFRNRNWRGMFDIDYEDVQWVATGEWLTEETWNKYSKEQPQGMVNHHYVKEPWVETALKWPAMMVSTDALPALDLSVMTNPNIAGTYSRVLGHYVRDQKLFSLREGLAKLSFNQAKWMGQFSPAFQKKGRIQEGMDADIVIFNPDTITANADYGKPYEKPTGLTHVLVAGRTVVVNSERVEGRYPGKRILGKGAAE